MLQATEQLVKEMVELRHARDIDTKIAALYATVDTIRDNAEAIAGLRTEQSELILNMKKFEDAATQRIANDKGEDDKPKYKNADQRKAALVQFLKSSTEYEKLASRKESIDTETSELTRITEHTERTARIVAREIDTYQTELRLVALLTSEGGK